MAEYCAQHASDGMVNVESRKCRTEDCGKHPSFGVTGTKTAEYCAQHAPDGMVNVKSRKCKTKDCRKGQLFGVAGTKTAEYCVIVQAYRVRRSTSRYGLSHRDQSRRDVWMGVITPHFRDRCITPSWMTALGHFLSTPSPSSLSERPV